MLRKGLIMSYVLLDDGSRQILRFLYPGDMLGISSAIYREAPETLCALSDCTVSPFDRSALTETMVAHPRLAAMILVYCQIERVALTDRLAALGRTSAKARVAALLLELRNRLRHTDKSITHSFTLGLTQEEVGDATGLTAVHVNRMLRQLEDEGMIAREFGPIHPARRARAAARRELREPLRRPRPELAAQAQLSAVAFKERAGARTARHLGLFFPPSLAERGRWRREALTEGLPLSRPLRPLHHRLRRRSPSPGGALRGRN